MSRLDRRTLSMAVADARARLARWLGTSCPCVECLVRELDVRAMANQGVADPEKR